MKADACAEIKYAKKGPGSKEENPPETIMQLMKACVEKYPHKVAMRVERVKNSEGRWVTPDPVKEGGRVSAPALPDSEWKTWTYEEFNDVCNAVAKSLLAMGVEQFGTVGIYGFNSPEWFISLLGAVFCGAKSAGIYPSDRTDNVVFKLKHSKARVVIIEDEGKLQRLLPQKDADGKEFNPMDDLPELKFIVTWAASDKCAKEVESKHGKVPVLNWEEFLKKENDTTNEALEKRQSLVNPGHCCALIYTSGTTGRPKAVMMSHDNVAFEVQIQIGQRLC